MDFLSIIGLVMGVGAIITSMTLDGGNVGALLQFSAFVIVGGGTLAAVLVESCAAGADGGATLGDVADGDCARACALPSRSASATIVRNSLALLAFMLPFALTKGSTRALPAL